MEETSCHVSMKDDGTPSLCENVKDDGTSSLRENVKDDELLHYVRIRMKCLFTRLWLGDG
ncbi:hypothetical protein KY284_027511 [Solanum tuberosum]|nr:hypothetical protein KY284_027511 [Solanum tuberosum]